LAYRKNGSSLPEATFHVFFQNGAQTERWKEHAALVLLHFRKIRESLYCLANGEGYVGIC
jgi:hypothetical protein